MKLTFCGLFSVLVEYTFNYPNQGRFDQTVMMSYTFNQVQLDLEELFGASLLHTDYNSLLSEDDSTDFEDLANHLFGHASSQSSMTLSSTGSSPSGDNVDSDNDLLSDNEPSIDLLKYLDSQDFDAGLKCEGDCNSCSETPNKYNKYRVSARQDPFMGIGGAGGGEDTGSASIRFSVGSQNLEQMWNPADTEFEEFIQEPILHQPGFSAWEHTPKTDDEPELMLTKSSITAEEEIEDVSFPETPSPSTQSGTITGDDSDVDIETVTETPNESDSCGYLTQDSSCSSPAISPSPLRSVQNGSLMSILAKPSASSAYLSTQSSSNSKQLRLNSYGISRDKSLAENLLIGRHSLLGQKRKLSKDKRCISKSQTQPAYTHILCTSNSVNFHDYAMSPGSCASYSSLPASTETGRPTVLSKRIYKRKQLALDASDKEKQHHHNQLERNRRQKLADLFVDLRDEVPKIANQPKASKVVILNESTVYIRELQELDTCQEELLTKEVHKAEMLKKQLKHLKAQLSGGVK